MRRNITAALMLAAALTLTLIQSAEAGRLRRLLYYSYPGAYITNLYTTNINQVVTYPDLPDAMDYMPPEVGGPTTVQVPFLAQTEISTAGQNDYGSLVKGYITVPETGNYVFYLAADDETEWWLTTDNANPLSTNTMTRICYVPGWTGSREWGKYPTQQSAPVALEANKTYAMRIIHKEGGGGDHIVLGWQKPSGVLELPMPPYYFQPEAITTFPGAATPEDDVEIVTGPVIPEAPGDATIYEGRTVVVYANINLPQPVTYQWLRKENGGIDFVPVQNATNAYYMFKATLADNGTYWDCRVTSGATVTNALNAGLVIVNTDFQDPSIISASTVPYDQTSIQVLFSEFVDPVTGTNVANYILTGQAITNATLQADGKTVVLKTSLMAMNQAWPLAISNIKDLANRTITPTNYTFTVSEGGLTFRYWDQRPADLRRLRYWSGYDTTSVGYQKGLWAEERTINTTSYAWDYSPSRQQFMAQVVGYLTPPETGYYKFAVASDDHSILYIGTNDQPSTKREVCNYNGSTGRWNTGAQLANQQSIPIWLEAGKRYYFEGVYRDGTGGDGISIFWQTPSGPPLPTANASVQAATQPFLIPIQYCSTFAPTPVAGALLHRAWDAYPTDLASLRTWSANGSTAPSYNKLFAEERVITTATYQWPLVPHNHDYAAQFIGYLTAPESGNYKFGISADDTAIIYLGTSEAASSKREVCSIASSSGQWSLTNATSQVSSNISLVAGKRYYIEVVYRDGGGGDGATLCWYTPSMAAASMVFPPVDSGSASVSPFVIPIGQLSTLSTNNYGYMAFTTNLPSSFNAAASSRPTLSVGVKGSIFHSYQWFKGAEPIAGATNASYTLPYVLNSDNGAQFSVVVSNKFSRVTSAAATLNVTADTSIPTVASVGSTFKGLVDVYMSEPVTSAGTTDNYKLYTSLGTPVTVTGAVLDPANASHVTLQTGPLPETDLLRMEIKDLVDAGSNTMLPATNTFRANNFNALDRIGNTQAFAGYAYDDRIALTAGGSDIWGTADQGVFLHKTVTNDFDYMLKGLAIKGQDNWTKLGLMARVDTSAGSRNYFSIWTPMSGQDTFAAQMRDTAGANSLNAGTAGTPLQLGLQGGQSGTPGVELPSYLRLKRVGNTFYWYRSLDAVNWTLWTLVDSTATGEGAFPAELEFGVAFTSHNTSRTADALVGSFSTVAPVLKFTLQPTNTTVVENGAATFIAAVEGTDSPFSYQWLRNGNPILDATNLSLTISPVSFCTDNNVAFSLRVTDYFGKVITSSPGLLTVLQDTVRPTVAFHATPKINLTPNEVKVRFSELVDPTSAQNYLNYTITTSPGDAPLAVSSATLLADGRTVTLATAAQTAGTIYKIVMNNVVDRACSPPNAILPTTDYFYYAGVSNTNYVQRDDGYIVMEAENAHVNDLTSGSALFQLQSVRAGASGAGYMVVPNNNNLASTGAGTGSNLYRTGPRMVYYIDFKRTGRHIVWMRGAAEVGNGNDDSFYIGFNNTVGLTSSNADYLVGMSTTADNSGLGGWGEAWSWRSDRVTDTAPANSDPLTFTNSAVGLHRFIVWLREDGTYADKIVIEAGDRAAGNTAAPIVCLTNNGVGDVETWAYLAAPVAPVVAIASPTNGQVLPPGNIVVTAAVTAQYPVTLVEFFEGTNLIGTATTPPYAINWSAVPDGLYSLTARVTDILGFQNVSSANAIAVDGTKPAALAVGSLGGDVIGVYFDDLTGLDPVSATNAANYVVNGNAVPVTGALLEPDNKTVLLTLASPVVGPFSVAVSGVADRGYGPNVVNPTTLDSTVVSYYFNQDVGTRNATNTAVFSDPVLPGTAEAISMDGMYVRAGGSDVWGTADGLHFVGRQLTGNFDVKVRVAAVLRPDQWTKAGLMIREDLDGNSRNIFLCATPTNGVNVIAMQTRQAKGGASAGAIPDANRPQTSPLPNAWLRVTGTNNVYTFLWATNGVDWTSLFTTNLSATPYTNVFVGLGTTSHNNGTNAVNLASVQYRNLSGLSPIVLSAVPAPGNKLAIAWPWDKTGMKLETQVNPISIGLGTSWSTVVGSQATNRVWVPVNSTDGSVFYRLAP